MNESEPSVLVDLKHGIAPFDGPYSEVVERRDSLLNRCKRMGIEREATEALRILKLSEIRPDEFEYIIAKRRMPRRLEMRLRNGS